MFRLIALIFLSLLFGLSHSISGFCRTGRQFRSVFNLGSHLVFQDFDEQILWKLTETYDPKPDGTHIEIKDKSVERDHQLTDFLLKYFNFVRPIVALNVKNKTFCDNLSDEAKTMCEQVIWDSRSTFVCFYGYYLSETTNQLQLVEAFKYDDYMLHTIDSDPLLKNVHDYCLQQFPNEPMLNSSLPRLDAALQYYYNDSERNNSLVRTKLLVTDKLDPTKQNIILFAERAILGDNGSEAMILPQQALLHERTFRQIFYYNNILGIFGCPHKCSIDSPLFNLKVVEGTVISEPSNLTFEDLVRCPRDVSWNPIEFCGQNEMQSIFNLGLDIIFQNSGKIWRYLKTGPNNWGNYAQKENIEKIRFDSDMSDHLSDTFDLSQPIYGFSFKNMDTRVCQKAPKHMQPICRKNLKIPPFYRACIYGQRVYFSANSDKPYWQKADHAYIYKPEGLVNFTDNRARLATSEFCINLFNHKNFQQTADHEVTGMHCDTYSSETKNILWIVAKQPNTYEVLIHKTNFSKDWPELDAYRLEWSTYTYEPCANCIDFAMNILFYSWDHNIMLAAHHSNQDPSPNTYKMNQTTGWFDPRTGHIKRFYDSMLSLFQCPFRQSHSVVHTTDERLCKKYTPEDSVFQMGEYVYYQVDRRFYRSNRRGAKQKGWSTWGQFASHFAFDQYVTDLLNDCFDTRSRVTGYSFLRNKNEYVVLLWGRSRDNTRALGEHIFRTFRLGRHTLDVLEAVNNVDYLFFSEVTFGLLSDKLQKYLFLAMAHMDDHETTYDDTILDWQRHMNWTVPSSSASVKWMNWLVTVVNDSHLYLTKALDKFEFPFDKDAYLTPMYPNGWIQEGKYKEHAPFRDMFGMFGSRKSEKNKQLMAVAFDRDTKVEEPYVYIIYDYRPEVNKTYVLFKDDHASESFSNYFQCGEEGQRSVAQVFLSFLLIFLLVLALIAVIVVIFIYIRRQKQQKSAEDATAVQSKSDSERTDKSIKRNGNHSSDSVKDQKSVRSKLKSEVSDEEIN